MADSTGWFERDDLWKVLYPVLFGQERWERAPEAITLLLALAAFPPGGRVLDLCCGPGRHSLELARRGFRVTGVDRTAGYIEEGLSRAEAEGLEVEFVLDDMRHFRRPAAFDAAINLFTSFGYFDDLEEDLLVLENVHASLTPGGVLVMDLVGREIVARGFRERDWSWIDESRGSRLLEERKLIEDWGRIENTWTILDSAGEQVIHFSHRLYSGTQLSALLRRAGFEGVTLFGSLAGRPYDQNAQRLVAVARRS